MLCFGTKGGKRILAAASMDGGNAQLVYFAKLQGLAGFDPVPDTKRSLIEVRLTGFQKHFMIALNHQGSAGTQNFMPKRPPPSLSDSPTGKMLGVGSNISFPSISSSALIF